RTGQANRSLLYNPSQPCFLGEPSMYGPGGYKPDPTERITTVNDPPAPQLVAYHRDHKQTACPRCSQLASRHKSGQRMLHDLGDLCTGHPIDLLVTYSSH